MNQTMPPPVSGAGVESGRAVQRVVVIGVGLIVFVLLWLLGFLPFIFGVLVPYAAVIVFTAGFVSKVVGWGRSPVPFKIPTTCGQQKSLPWIKASPLDNPSNALGVMGRLFLEVVFFRSLFRNHRMVLRKEGPRLAYISDKILWAAALAFHGEGIRVLNLAQARPEVQDMKLDTPADVLCLAFDSQGERLAAGLEDGSLQVLEAPGFRERVQCTGHEDGIVWVRFDPPGRRLLTLSRDGTVRLWDGATGRGLGLFSEKGDRPGCAAFNAREGKVAVGYEGGKVILYDTGKGHVLQQFETHRGQVPEVLDPELAQTPLSPGAETEPELLEKNRRALNATVGSTVLLVQSLLNRNQALVDAVPAAGEPEDFRRVEVEKFTDSAHTEPVKRLFRSCPQSQSFDGSLQFTHFFTVPSK